MDAIGEKCLRFLNDNLIQDYDNTLAKEIILGSKKECKYGVNPVSTFKGNIYSKLHGLA